MHVVFIICEKCFLLNLSKVMRGFYVRKFVSGLKFVFLIELLQKRCFLDSFYGQFNVYLLVYCVCFARLYKIKVST